mmetsp:Transcript_39140/g.93544  ORF Transcript_39140/g.93544 Transcript_39140/m.93544 type:complete len:363 (-) Transcript_39140:272-1360(-)
MVHVDSDSGSTQLLKGRGGLVHGAHEDNIRLLAGRRSPRDVHDGPRLREALGDALADTAGGARHEGHQPRQSLGLLRAHHALCPHEGLAGQGGRARDPGHSVVQYLARHRRRHCHRARGRFPQLRAQQPGLVHHAELLRTVGQKQRRPGALKCLVLVPLALLRLSHGQHRQGLTFFVFAGLVARRCTGGCLQGFGEVALEAVRLGCQDLRSCGTLLSRLERLLRRGGVLQRRLRGLLGQIRLGQDEVGGRRNLRLQLLLALSLHHSLSFLHQRCRVLRLALRHLLFRGLQQHGQLALGDADLTKRQQALAQRSQGRIPASGLLRAQDLRGARLALEVCDIAQGPDTELLEKAHRLLGQRGGI